jgi:hypothetical protein
MGPIAAQYAVNSLPIAVMNWRDDSSGPMQVVSGSVGRERVHFEHRLRSDSIER